MSEHRTDSHEKSHFRYYTCKYYTVSISMSVKKVKTPTSYANPGFDEKPTKVANSNEASPMGSNIFIVTPDGKKNSRSHPDPFRHEPVTQQNIGRTILRSIRCK